MTIEITNFLWSDPSILHGSLDTSRHALSLGMRLCHVVSIAGVCASQILCIDRGATSLRMLQRLQAKHPCTFAHDEAIPTLVPGPRGPLGLIVPRRERFASLEASYACPRHCCLSSASQGKVTLTLLDVLRGRGDAVVAGGTGSDHCVVWALEAQVDGKQSPWHIHECVGHEEGRQLLPFHELFHTFHRRLQGSAAHCRTN
mmetsp:Transcript_81357/g.143579  ORF Transcript_81357/g.143579 Transcript_81357/m.143579 type:complete len:201 (-) Transcript_81357:570-1172(-)